MQPGTGFADQPLTGLRVARRLTRLRGLGREGWEGYLFLAPALAIFLLFLVIPTVWVLSLIHI